MENLFDERIEAACLFFKQKMDNLPDDPPYLPPNLIPFVVRKYFSGKKDRKKAALVLKGYYFAFLFGNHNWGKHNDGRYNVGSFNTGNGNLGSENKGNYNSGSFNVGGWNTGKYNIGNRNTGDSNIGSYNTGRRNVGNKNSGSCNRTDRANGFFNTKPTPLYIFNKPCKEPLDKTTISYVVTVVMSQCPSIGTRTVYHKDTGWVTLKEDRTLAQSWWDEQHIADKHMVIGLPNFNVKLFKEITGIQVNVKEIEKEFSLYLEEKEKKK